MKKLRILSISAQKPNSTGSGVYLSELVRALASEGYEQAVVAGISVNDENTRMDFAEFYPVYFGTDELPFEVVGMSDSMPYPNTLYSSLNKEMQKQYENAFTSVLDKAISEFMPDVIICHHLYLLCAIARERFPNVHMIGICHGTDLRQYKKTDLQRNRIKNAIAKLDRIYALHEAQKKDIVETFELAQTSVDIIGTGYNSDVFYDKNIREEKSNRIIFAGKVCYKKGVASLIKAAGIANKLLEGSGEIPLELFIAGGHSDAKEYKSIVDLAKKQNYNIKFLGKLSQDDLATEFSKANTMVLPSFYEGLPLVIIEAMACGPHVICTDLPGIKDWINKALPSNEMQFVSPPKMKNIDEPAKRERSIFEETLAKKLVELSKSPCPNKKEVETLSWKALAARLLKNTDI